VVLPTLPVWNIGFTVILLGVATYTDLRWRRIPNTLTFPAVGLGLILYLVLGGWKGLLLSMSGALLAPCILVLAHGGKGPGMGDIKLAAAIGALVGPPLAVVAMLMSMIAGGVVALIWMSKEWGMFGHGWLSAGIGKMMPARPKAVGGEPGNITIPYGLALALGTLMTLAVCLITGNNKWL